MQTQPNDKAELTPLQVRQLLQLMEGQQSGAQARTQADILLHAMAVFVRRGLARTTVQDLLNEAGVSRRTFYKYYHSKQDVLETIYRLLATNMVVRFEEQVRLARGDLRASIRRIVRIYVDYHLGMGPIIRLVLEEARRTDSPLAPHREQAYQQVVQLLKATIKRDSGREVEPLALLSLLWNLEDYSLYLASQHYSASACAKVERILESLACMVALGQPDAGLLEA